MNLFYHFTMIGTATSFVCDPVLMALRRTVPSDWPGWVHNSIQYSIQYTSCRSMHSKPSSILSQPVPRTTSSDYVLCDHCDLQLASQSLCTRQCTVTSLHIFSPICRHDERPLHGSADPDTTDSIPGSQTSHTKRTKADCPSNLRRQRTRKAVTN